MRRQAPLLCFYLFFSLTLLTEEAFSLENNNRKDELVFLGDKKYASFEIIKKFTFNKYFSKKIGENTYIIQYFTTVSPEFNKCSNTKFPLTWLWSGASKTGQPQQITDRKLSSIEEDIYYTIKFSSLSNENPNKLFDELIDSAQPQSSEYPDITIAELRPFFPKHSITASINEDRKLLIRGGRIIGIVDTNEQVKDSPVIGLKFENPGAGYSLGFSAGKKASERATIACMIATSLSIDEFISKSER